MHNSLCTAGGSFISFRLSLKLLYNKWFFNVDRLNVRRQSFEPKADNIDIIDRIVANLQFWTIQVYVGVYKTKDVCVI